MVALQAFVNIYAFKIVVWMELLSGILHCVLFIVFIAVTAVMGTRNGGDFFLSKNVSSGWDDYFVSWNVGMLSCVWIFTGRCYTFITRALFPSGLY